MRNGADIPASLIRFCDAWSTNDEHDEIRVAGLDKRWLPGIGLSRQPTLATFPGIGAVTASAILAPIGDGKQFRSGREFAAWIGIVPRQNSAVVKSD